jgi:hypothetical protein
MKERFSWRFVWSLPSSNAFVSAFTRSTNVCYLGSNHRQPLLRILPSQKETVPAPHFKRRGFFMNQQMFLFFLLFFLALLCTLCWPHPGPAQSRAAAKMRTMLRRHLKPRCPDDCPACRLASTASSSAGPAPLPVRPWCEVKSRRGAPKRIDTQGFACPNPQCPYADAQIHALVGDGKHGQAERIQTFRCQACRTTSVLDATLCCIV